MKKLIVPIVAAIVLFSTASAYAWLYYSKPEFRGRVIDSETKQPIEGAVVVIIYDKWPLIGGPGGKNSHVYKAKETLTDSKGDFSFPPVTSFSLASLDAGIRFIFYKPGYMSVNRIAGIQIPEERYFSIEKDKLGREGEIEYVDRWDKTYTFKIMLKLKSYICYLISISFLLIYNSIYALDVNTHKALNETITKNSTNGFSLNDYLKNQLGMSKGYDEKIVNKEVYLWISDGGEFEDSYIRPLNHFLNPLTNRGLKDINPSALAWATLPVGGQSMGSYSWNDARSYYYKAQTSTNKSTRETNYADMFRAAGQVMHLVQDMSVPAHTRDDMHLSILGIGGDDYENWAKTIAIAGYTSSPKSYEPGASFPLTIQNIFDTDQYNGSYPGITIQNAIGLAEYTNANFLSPDKRCRINNLEVHV